MRKAAVSRGCVDLERGYGSPESRDHADAAKDRPTIKVKGRSSPLPRLIGCITAKPDPLERAALQLLLRFELAWQSRPIPQRRLLVFELVRSAPVVRLCCGRDGSPRPQLRCLSNAKKTSTALINRAVPGALRSGGIDASLEPIQGLPAGSDERRSLLPFERPWPRKGRQGYEAP
jgi:hypothetical protein